ncbi:MAG: hypothetical protein V4616_14775 [Bacteroidota bacterium]
MKKLFIVGAIALGATLTSCKKDFVCSCTTENPLKTPEKYTISNTTKGDAGDTCDNYETTRRADDATAACGLD